MNVGERNNETRKQEKGESAKKRFGVDVTADVPLLRLWPRRSMSAVMA